MRYEIEAGRYDFGDENIKYANETDNLFEFAKWLHENRTRILLRGFVCSHGQRRQLSAHDLDQLIAVGAMQNAALQRVQTVEHGR